jgi:hypothetical protein
MRQLSFHKFIKSWLGKLWHIIQYVKNTRVNTSRILGRQFSQFIENLTLVSQDLVKGDERGVELSIALYQSPLSHADVFSSFQTVSYISYLKSTFNLHDAG